MNLIEYFNENQLKEESKQTKFVIILGSGWHKNVFGKVENGLNSWACLLKSIQPNFTFSGNYILDFELIISNRAGIQTEKTAREIEIDILKEIVNEIKKLQKIAIDDKSSKYPIEIFNPKYVRDVISLNFDTVAEELLSQVNARNNYSHTMHDMNPCFHNIVQGINFWYPHGNITNSESMIFGLREYGKILWSIEDLRCRYKQNERILRKFKDNSSEISISEKEIIKTYNPSWIDAIMDHPVLVLGASLSEVEWDIWFALVNRKRNFEKESNKEFETPVFLMRGDEGLSESKKTLFEDIIPHPSFKEQWDAITKLFSSQDKEDVKFLE